MKYTDKDITVGFKFKTHFGHYEVMELQFNCFLTLVKTVSNEIIRLEALLEYLNEGEWQPVVEPSKQIVYEIF
jgi:hypothetical protein